MSKESKNKIYSTLFIAVITVIIGGQIYAGFMLAFVILPLMIWIPYSVYVIIKKPDIRILQFTRVSIWLGAIAIIATIHYIRHETTRHHADEIVAAINAFSTKHGHYPTTLDEVGIHRQQLEVNLRYSDYYVRNDGEPKFNYRSTFIVFDTYDYNFETGTWECC